MRVPGVVEVLSCQHGGSVGVCVLLGGWCLGV